MTPTKKNYRRFFTRLTWVISTLASLLPVVVGIVERIAGSPVDFNERLIGGLILSAIVWTIHGVLYVLYLALKWAYQGLKDNDNNS